MKRMRALALAAAAASLLGAPAMSAASDGARSSRDGDTERAAIQEQIELAHADLKQILADSGLSEQQRAEVYDLVDNFTSNYTRMVAADPERERNLQDYIDGKLMSRLDEMGLMSQASLVNHTAAQWVHNELMLMQYDTSGSTTSSGTNDRTDSDSSRQRRKN